METYRKRARALDAADPLKAYRARFASSLEGIIYLDGNSLGPLPEATEAVMEATVGVEWKRGLIRSWNERWYDLPLRLGDLLGPVIGSKPGQTCFCDSVTVNFIKLAAAALKANPGRRKLVTDAFNFPSNFYAAGGLADLMDQDHFLETVASKDGMTIPVKAYETAIDEDTALVFLSHVVYKSGYLQDLEAITRMAHAKGAMVLADLSHSVGSVPIELDKWGVDMAVGCSYKFLNGGPGAPAFLYAREELIDQLKPGLNGWFGCADPFQFKDSYEPAPGIARFLVGTPPIISMRAIEPGLAITREAGMGAIREKSVALSGFFLELFDELLVSQGFSLGSPRDAAQRGSHISLKHPEAFRINKALIQPGSGGRPVIPDFRTPDNLRIGISPLYLQFSDIVEAVQRIHRIVANREYETFDHASGTVT